MSAKAKPAPISASPPARSQRLREAMAVQAIEDNPLDDEQIAMFDMFEREGWSHEQRRAWLMARLLSQRPE